MIAAAFIGPGTVTACTIAGVSFGMALLWALLFSIVATIILQEMASRIGLVTHKGLAQAIQENISSKMLRVFVLILILSAILIGNAAYEGGNIGGAVLGLQSLFGETYKTGYALIIGLIAFLLLWQGNYKTLERFFVALIFLMSLSFIITAILTKPDLGALVQGLLVPTLPEDGLLNVLALIGTTIVPYNLFLHASLVNEKWRGVEHLKTAKIDTTVSIAIGGLVSMAIIVAASAIDIDEVSGANDLARGLEPLFGDAAKYFMGIGLFTAGITSSITAPLAAAYVANSCFGWKADLKDWRFRIVWIAILVIGVASLSLNIRPIDIINFAQIANAVLLPIIAILLVVLANKSKVLGKYKNTLVQNILGFLIIAITVFLGIKSIVMVLGWV